MAKAKSPPKKLGRESFRLDIFQIDLLTKLGVTGSIFVCGLYVFLKNGSLEQHREFIDKFILLKTRPGDNKYIFYVVIVVIIAFISQALYFKTRIKLKDERIRELEHQNNLLENKLLKK